MPRVEIILKKYSDSVHETLLVDVPESGAITKVTDGIHIRLSNHQLTPVHHPEDK